MLLSHAAAQRLCRGLGRGCLCRAATSKSAAASLLRDEPRAVAARRASRSSGELAAPLKRWTVAVKPFGSVRVQLPCSISVRPLDPHSFPEANRALVTVRGALADGGLGLGDVRVRYDEHGKELLIASETVDGGVSVDLSAPLNNDLRITTSGQGNVSIRKMECDTCQVVTENGNCVLDSIKSRNVVVQSAGGSIKGTGTIHGNVDISTSGNSTIDIKKIQGARTTVATEHGSLSVAAIYAESACVSSSTGNVKLGSVHGDSTVRSEKGSIVIDGSDGCLRVSSLEGDIDVYVGQRSSAELHTQHGSVSIRVPASASAAVLLHGVSVDVSPEVDLQEAKRRSTDTHTIITARLNGEADGGQHIDAWAEKGVVRLKTQSWFESLKIGSRDNAGQQTR